MKILYQIFTLITTAILYTSTVYTCPNCKDAYEVGSHDAMIGESYSWSVVFFLSMFIGLLVFGFIFIRWQYQKHSIEKDLNLFLH